MLPTIIGKPRLGGLSGMKTAERIKSYSLIYTVQADPGTGPMAIQATAGLPIYGDHYKYNNEEDVWALFARLSVQQRPNNQELWDVTVEFGTLEIDYKKTQADNPLMRPYEISGNTTPYQRVLEWDQDHKAFLNSAGQPLPADVATVDDSRLVFVVTRNEPGPPLDKYKLKDKVNGGVWLGFPARTLKFSALRFQRKFEKGILYYQVSYEFQFNADTWKRVALDVGDYALDDKDDTKIDVLRTKNNEIALGGPIALDGNGHRMAKGWDPSKIEFRVYDDADFGELGL